MNPYDTYEIHDKMFGTGSHQNIGIKKIGAIKELRNMIHDVFGPPGTDGNGHGVGLKEVKDYVEQEMNIYNVWNDAYNLAWCFFLKADSGWMIHNQITSKASVEGVVESFYIGGHVQAFRPMNQPKATIDLSVKEMTGQIVGWRAFRYEMQNIGPLSHRWHDFNTIGKTIDKAPNPDFGNEYGFWSFKKKSDLLKYLKQWQGAFGKTSSFLYATVLLTGEIVEHEAGFRAKEIEILGLYSGLNNSQRRGIAHKLGWYGKVLPIEMGQEEFPYNITEV